MSALLADDPVQRSYFDNQFQRNAFKVLPGEYYVTEKDMVLVTVLGSCVSACIRDRESGIGGMNHFMLPDSSVEVSYAPAGSARYGVNAMELMINTLLKRGARREFLEAKVFGGGNVMSTFISNNVGRRNADFVLNYLKTEHISLVGCDLLEDHPRKVYYFPATGRAMVKALYVLNNDTISLREHDYRSRLASQSASGAIELFH
ncbi:MAG: chemoreceptor glutamine deamidase CheD [Burkholderiales bacterium]|nr:chemoreceptor glutamine deamidase CheD [Burkholderiales bacterium]